MVLEVKELNKEFTIGLNKKKKVLEQVSFKVPQGGATGFVGVNGSGKTTTLKCLFNFIIPNSGKIHFFKNELLSSSVKNRIGYLPERPYFYDFLSSLEFLRFHWELGGGGPGFLDAAKKVLQRVNLVGVEKTSLRSFSKGMLQRIGIAQAILRKPQFLILDEPMSGLDPDGRYLIKEIIRAEKKEGTTLFFSSHLLSDVEELCENLVIIDQGKILFNGLLADFLLQYKSQLDSKSPSNSGSPGNTGSSGSSGKLEKTNGQESEHEIGRLGVDLELAFKNLREKKI